jgi:AAA domain-containing protein
LRRDKDPLQLSLPTHKSKPSSRLQDYSILLYGAKKIGKSQLSAQFDSCLQMMTEPGAKAIAGYQVPVPDWKHFRKYVDLLVKDREFENVSIDTADIAYQMCLQYVCKDLGIDHPSDEEWGKGWAAVRQEFQTQVNRLLHSGKGVMFISHATEREIKTRTGKKYDILDSTMAKAARETLEGIVDIWVCAMYNDDGDRVLRIAGDEYVAAGHRLKDRFRYTDGTPIEEIDMGENPEQAYQNFVSAFKNELKNPVAPQKKKARVRLALKTKGLRIRKGR